MLRNISALLLDNAARPNYGAAVTDADGDGHFEIVVAGFGGRNLLLKWDGSALRDIAPPLLADVGRQAIGVAAADIDADGQEEIYVLNTDTFGGRKQVGDRLFDRYIQGWVDLFSLPENFNAVNLIAGRSVAALDRDGDGRYGFVVASYGGPLRLYELGPDARLVDVASEAGLALTTGGRSLIALPLVSGGMDVFAANEHGANFLFRNRGDGTFEEEGQQRRLGDMHENGRGVAALDANGSGRFDLVLGNWEGPHRLFIQDAHGEFHDQAPPALAAPSRVRTVIAADLDNDGYEEIFFNNIGQPNRLFGWRDGAWQPIDIGEAAESDGFGTGAVVGDFDEDGQLELLITHGEMGAQPLSLYCAPPGDNHWLRVLPLTVFGAPARGALVRLFAGGRVQLRAVDAGSGYLCQMEPVAHFGLGAIDQVDRVEVHWPDGVSQVIDTPQPNRLLRVQHPRRGVL